MSSVNDLRQRANQRMRRAIWAGLAFCSISVAFVVALGLRALWRWA